MKAAAMCAYIWWTFETYVHDKKQGIRHFFTDLHYESVVSIAEIHVF